MIQIPQVSTLEALQIAISDGAKMLLTTKEWARRVPKVMTLSSLLALFLPYRKPHMWIMTELIVT